jgi:hypothetical protein
VTIQPPSPAKACSPTAVWPCHMPRAKYDFADPPSEQRWRLAVHEAGHAVIARKAGLAIRRVSIATATSDVRGGAIAIAATMMGVARLPVLQRGCSPMASSMKRATWL